LITFELPVKYNPRRNQDAMSRFFSTAILLILYHTVELVVLVHRYWGGRADNRNGPILIIATFHNQNWAVSHILPIASASRLHVTVVTDPVDLILPNVTFRSPSSTISNIFPRALAKCMLALRLAVKERPSFIIGYHFFPAGLIALLCRSVAGGSAVYQSTGGQIEIEGGGWNSENRLLRALKTPSRRLEKKSISLLRKFDYIIGRGTRIEKFLTEREAAENYRTILGSVEIPASVPGFLARDLDIIFLGRLAESKRLDLLLRIVGLLVVNRPGLRVAIIGDGERKPFLIDLCTKLGIGANVHFTGRLDNASTWLRRSKLFVLTSRTEGVSIAMLEAMAQGVVPVVIDVGELSSVVNNGVNGYLIRSPSKREFSHRIEDLLSDPARWQSFSNCARLGVTNIAGRETVIEQWRALFSSNEDANTTS